MAHTHQWQTRRYLMLSLPDVDGFSDRYTQWICATCPLYVEIDGNVRLGTPLHTPEYWDAVDPTSPTRTSRGARQWLRAQRG